MTEEKKKKTLKEHLKDAATLFGIGAVLIRLAAATLRFLRASIDAAKELWG